MQEKALYRSKTSDNRQMYQPEDTRWTPPNRTLRRELRGRFRNGYNQSEFIYRGKQGATAKMWRFVKVQPFFNLLCNTCLLNIMFLKLVFFLKSKINGKTITVLKVNTVQATTLVSDQLKRRYLWNPVWTVYWKALVSDHSRMKQPRPLLGLSNWTFPLFLSSHKRPLRVLFI